MKKINVRFTLFNVRFALGLFLTSVLTFSTSAISSHVNLQTDLSGKEIRYVIKIKTKSAFEMGHYAKWLSARGYDVAGYSWKKGQIEVVTDQKGIEKLNQFELAGFAKGALWSDGDVGLNGIDARFLNPAKVEAKLKELQAKYPQYTRLEQIGTSFQGRAVWALLVSTSAADDSAAKSKPSIIFDGMHHAREIMTSEVVMDVAERSLEVLANNSEGADLLKQWNIWVVPMLNVDGNNLVWTQSSMWRKNARAEGGKTFGVDINRNYPFNWNKCGGASNSKTAQDYRGTAGGSEPETQALMNLAQRVQPTASLSYHSYSELVLYPYGCNGVVTGDNALVSAVASEVAQILPSDYGSGFYDPGTPWNLLYDVDGDSMSYMHGEFGALALTFEINLTFQPNYETKATTVEKHRKAWNYFLNRLTTNMLTLKVVDARTNEQAPATIGISNILLVQGEKPFRTNSAGYYFKVLNPGDYTLTIQLADGRTQTANIKMESQPQSLTVRIN